MVENPEAFTLAAYEGLLCQALAASYSILPLEETVPQLPPRGRMLVLRHDIDFCPAAAAAMARLEARLGVRSTYCVLLHSPTYHLDEIETLVSLREIRDLGHRLGLHYDLSWFEAEGIEPLDGIVREAHRLGEALNVNVKSVAQHLPSRQGQFQGVGDRFVDAYSPRLTREILYISDSRRQWRNRSLAECIGSVDRLQALIHPVWWTATPLTRRRIIERLAQDRRQKVGCVLEEYLKRMEARDGETEAKT